MTNLHTDEIVVFVHLTKIGTDKNKTTHSISPRSILTKQKQAQIPSKTSIFP